MKNDTIILNFFYDFIQLEIKATNIVNGLNNYQQKTSDLDSMKTNLLKYPLEKLTTSSLVDSLDKESKLPVYIRYCVNLILEDIGDGDLMCTNKRYKYIKDIQLVN